LYHEARNQGEHLETLKFKPCLCKEKIPNMKVFSPLLQLGSATPSEDRLQFFFPAALVGEEMGEGWILDVHDLSG